MKLHDGHKPFGSTVTVCRRCGAERGTYRGGAARGRWKLKGEPIPYCHKG